MKVWWLQLLFLSLYNTNTNTMGFELKIWETEDDREMGETFSHTPEDTSLEGAIMEAQKLFYRMDYAAIEVIDEEDENEETHYHISNDVPSGERYTK